MHRFLHMRSSFPDPDAAPGASAICQRFAGASSVSSAIAASSPYSFSYKESGLDDDAAASPDQRALQGYAVRRPATDGR